MWIPIKTLIFCNHTFYPANQPLSLCLQMMSFTSRVRLLMKKFMIFDTNDDVIVLWIFEELGLMIQMMILLCCG